MPTLVNPDHIDALREKVAGMKGSVAEITEALNAPTQAGVRYEALDARTVIDILGSTFTALEMAATAEGGSEAAPIIIGYLAYPGTLEVAEGTKGREWLDAAVGESLVSEAERAALVAEAEEPDMSGPSWGQKIGIGRITTMMVQEVRTDGK